jgi:hypothetical protein
MSMDKKSNRAINDLVQVCLDHFLDTGSQYSYSHVELMKQEKTTGEISMETVFILMLNEQNFKYLKPILPHVNNDEFRTVWLEVLEETVKRLGKLEDPVDNPPE